MDQQCEWQITRLTQLKKEVEYDILRTPSSPKRERLTDANIHMSEALNKLKESQNAPQQY